jgi:hypothetical protein
LPAASLFTAKLYRVSQTTQYLSGGQTHLRSELVNETGDEEGDVHVLAKEGLVESAVDRDDLSRGLGETLRD